jgi:hypothetical protein
MEEFSTKAIIRFLSRNVAGEERVTRNFQNVCRGKK